ncbi:MAG: hypothetical protein ABR949_10110 [Candidatus Aquilonibacter sp.]|jgi:hypothetical protein
MRYAEMLSLVGEPEERVLGSVQFADPSTTAMLKVNEGFIGPTSSNTGPRTAPTNIRPITGREVPWEDRTGAYTQDTWAAMNTKRGTVAPEDPD